MKFNLTDEELDEIPNIQEDVEDKSKIIDDIVYGIISPCLKTGRDRAFSASPRNERAEGEDAL